jgi:hypothetical protein
MEAISRFTQGITPLSALNTFNNTVGKVRLASKWIGGAAFLGSFGLRVRYNKMVENSKKNGKAPIVDQSTLPDDVSVAKTLSDRATKLTVGILGLYLATVVIQSINHRLITRLES